MENKQPSSVLWKDTRDPLHGFSREGLIEELQGRLRGRVEEAWVFGSFARGEALRAGSDVDLALVVSTEFPFLERSEMFFDLLDLGPQIDILVYTPEEWKALTSRPTVGFWSGLVRDKRRLL